MAGLVPTVSGFASGVFLRSLFLSGWPVAVFALLLAAIFGAAAFWKPRLAYSLGAVFCVCIALGIGRAALAEHPLPSVFSAELKQRVSYDATVVGDPDLRDANQRVPLLVSAHGTSVKMLAVAPRTPAVSVGEHVRVSGTLALPAPFADDGGRTFRYDKYLERDGIRYLLNFAVLRVTAPAPWYSLPAALARVKHSFLNGIAATIPEPYASLAGGVVIGGKSGLGADLQNAFVRSGLVQIIVLSGYNVMVVAEWVMAALAFFKLPRRVSAGAGAAALLAFVLIAGASATAVRAALMALIALYARATGRSYAASRALFFAILLMLFWNPLYLAFDPGFGLSVAATAGLIWLAPLIELRLARLTNAFWRNAIATTLAAQIAVLPLLLYDTGNLSFIAIPANLIVMPVVPLAMGLSALAGVAGMLFGGFAPLLGIILGFPAYLATAFLILVAKGSAAIPFAALTLPPFPFWLVLATYAALIVAAARLRIKNPAVACASAGMFGIR